MMYTSFVNKIPLMIVGVPATSKSLSISILKDYMTVQDKNQNVHNVIKDINLTCNASSMFKLNSFILFYDYQLNKLTHPDNISKIFKLAKECMKKSIANEKNV